VVERDVAGRYRLSQRRRRASAAIQDYIAGELGEALGSHRRGDAGIGDALYSVYNLSVKDRRRCDAQCQQDSQSTAHCPLLSACTAGMNSMRGPVAPPSKIHAAPAETSVTRKTESPRRRLKPVAGCGVGVIVRTPVSMPTVRMPPPLLATNARPPSSETAIATAAAMPSSGPARTCCLPSRTSTNWLAAASIMSRSRPPGRNTSAAAVIVTVADAPSGPTIVTRPEVPTATAEPSSDTASTSAGPAIAAASGTGAPGNPRSACTM